MVKSGSTCSTRPGGNYAPARAGRTRRAGRYARKSRRSARRGAAASRTSTPRSSGRSLRPSTSSTRRSMRLSDVVEEQIRPPPAQRDLLMTIPGVKQRTAEVMIAEIGVRHQHASPPPSTSPRGRKSAPGTTSPPAKTLFRQDRQGQQMAQSHADPIRQRSRPHQEHLPLSPIPAPTRSPRPRQSNHRREPRLHRRLAHVQTGELDHSARTTSPNRTPNDPPNA